MKTLVLVSGGVDSAIAALILKQKGFQIAGAFMKLAENEKFKEGEKRARKICQILKIPFFVFDLKKEFKKKIVDSFLKDLKRGITPNPCIFCNKEIKFGILLEKALKLNFDFVATGHYARVEKKKGKFYLLRAKDKKRDQSYFLWKLGQKELKRILFPIGNLKREKVKALFLKIFPFPFWEMRKSVELCFVKKTIKDFLKENLKEKRGKIIDKEGKILGEHKGIWFYTIGQRKDLRLAGGPYFVLKKDAKKNLLIVTKNEKDLLRKNLIFKNVNWILGKEPKLPLKVKAKIRYKSSLSLAVLEKISSNFYSLTFKKPQRAITPGQSVVFYKEEKVLGGGIIFK